MSGLRFGLLGARADRGGLGAMTQEFARQLQPERVLGIELGERGRGVADWTLFPGAVVNEGMDSDLPEELVRRFCHGLDVVYAAETFYRSDVADIARQVGCRTVLHSMPELWRADHAAPDQVWAPTSWELGRLPADTLVVPVPVARERLPFRQRTEALRLYHLAAPAMLDRNGTRLLAAACQLVQEDVELLTAGSAAGGRWPHVRAQTLPPVRDYYDVHPASADLLVLPRRYAGLSLPMQECAAMGMGILTLDLEPQRQWVPPEGLVAAQPWRRTNFPGGEFTIATADPRQLAASIDRLARHPEQGKALSAASDEHAEALSWDAWRDRYLGFLEAAAA